MFYFSDTCAIFFPKFHRGQDITIEWRDICCHLWPKRRLSFRIAASLGRQRSVPERQGMHNLPVSFFCLKIFWIFQSQLIHSINIWPEKKTYYAHLVLKEQHPNKKQGRKLSDPLVSVSDTLILYCLAIFPAIRSPELCR